MKRIIFLSLIALLGLNVSAVAPGSQVNQEDKILHKTLDEIKKTFGDPISDDILLAERIAVFKITDSLYYSCFFREPDNKCYQYIVRDIPTNIRVIDQPNTIAQELTDAYSSSSNAGIGGYGTWDLGGRDMLGDMPRPKYNGIKEEGRVVVTIKVDPKGNVIDTRINNRTNTTNLQLRNAAIEAARKTKFNAIVGDNNQTGTITYYFKLK